MTEKRTKRIEIALSESEYLLLQERKTKPRLAQYIRETALSKETEHRPQPRAVNPELLKELNKIGVNLNQIAKKLNSHSEFSVTEKVNISISLTHIQIFLQELLSAY